MDLPVADIRLVVEGCLRAAGCHLVAVATGVLRKADRRAVTVVLRKVARPVVTVVRRKVARPVATVARRKVVRPRVATEVRLPAASVVRPAAAWEECPAE